MLVLKHVRNFPRFMTMFADTTIPGSPLDKFANIIRAEFTVVAPDSLESPAAKFRAPRDRRYNDAWLKGMFEVSRCWECLEQCVIHTSDEAAWVL